MSWEKNYNKLRDYFAKNGDSRVPYRFKDDPALGRWVQKVRLNKETLTKSQLKRLNEINFVWKEDIQKEKRKNWLTMYMKLKKFKEREGHCNVPSKYEPEKQLGRWVEVIRTRKDHLEDWQLEKLRAIGFNWPEDIKLKKKKHWYAMFTRLQAFYDKYQHSDVPEYWSEDPELSIWVMAQRRPKKPLPRERKMLLELVNFSFNGQIGLNKRDEKGRFKTRVEEKIHSSDSSEFR